MVGVGEAAARGKLPNSGTMRRLRSAAAGAPLEPEIYLVEGAIAQKRGQAARAVRFLLAARARDPRSPAARYLLADQYLRSGRTGEGLAELAVLTKLMPRAGVQLVPALQQYARAGGPLDPLRRLLRSNPLIEQQLLDSLSRDARNADLVVALGADRAEDIPGQWRANIVDRLLKEGQYRRAFQVWSRLSGVSGEPTATLFDPRFEQAGAPAPFNWSLADGGGGVAEPSDGGLRVLYYGREDLALASQATLLPPGHYRLQAKISGKLPGNGSVQWVVTCLGSGRELLRGPLSSNGSINFEFTVPNACEAQRVTLFGKAGELAQSADFRIGGLQLRRSAG